MIPIGLNYEVGLNLGQDSQHISRVLVTLVEDVDGQGGALFEIFEDVGCQPHQHLKKDDSKDNHSDNKMPSHFIGCLLFRNFESYENGEGEEKCNERYSPGQYHMGKHPKGSVLVQHYKDSHIDGDAPDVGHPVVVSVNAPGFTHQDKYNQYQSRKN